MTPNGDAQDCQDLGNLFTGLEPDRSIRVNTSTFWTYLGLNYHSAMHAVMAAAAVWNDQHGGPTFRVVGSSAEMTLPEFLDGPGGCTALGVNYSLVRTIELCSSLGGGYLLGHAYAKCKTSNGAGTQFLVAVCAKTYNPLTQEIIDNPPWTGGWPVPSNESDIIRTLSHEFGHTMNIGHPLPGQVSCALMNQTGSDECELRRLYYYDKRCAVLNGAGLRNTLAYKRSLYSNGTIGSATVLQSFPPSLHIAVGGPMSGAHLYVRTTPSTGRFATYGGIEKVISPLPANNSSLSVLTYLYPELPSNQMGLVYSAAYPDEPYLRSETFRTHVVQSADFFSTFSFAGMSVCQFNDGDGCLGDYKLKLGTPFPIAEAWLPSLQRSVRAIVDHRYTVSLHVGMVLSPASYQGWVLPAPAIGGDAVVLSRVTPGLVCTNGAAGGYDCLLAYVSAAELDLRVRVRRFSVTGTGPYTVTWDPWGPYLVSGSSYEGTASRIAAWYSGGQFRLAYLKSAANPTLIVYKSTTGSMWSWDTTLTDSPVSGPSASSRSSSSYLMYVQ
ncbi:MAG: hypothetical protein RBU37_09440 [Myxococcota bacterium]|nr:hypothetical protein [Myxococcota bacterium]